MVLVFVKVYGNPLTWDVQGRFNRERQPRLNAVPVKCRTSRFYGEARMSEFGKRQGGGRRSAARTVAPLAAVFTTVTRSHAAVLVDLSCTGARLSGEDLPETGEELMLAVGNLRAFATVIWTGAGECGVHFDVPLASGDVALVRCEVARQGGLAPDLKAALDDWTTGLAR